MVSHGLHTIVILIKQLGVVVQQLLHVTAIVSVKLRIQPPELAALQLFPHFFQHTPPLFTTNSLERFIDLTREAF